MGLGLGIKIFDADGGEANSFLSYGVSINTLIDIGENVQVFYLNTINLSYNPRYNEMGRTSHEFYIFYNSKWRVQPTLCPYIETFRFNENKANLDNIDKTFRYYGVKVGLTKQID